MIEPAFKLCLNPDYSDTVVIETYFLSDEDFNLGGLTTIESLHSISERRGKDFLQGETLDEEERDFLWNESPLESEKTFRIEPAEKLEDYSASLREMAENLNQNETKPLKKANAYIEFIESDKKGEDLIARFDKPEIPVEFSFIYLDLNRMAYENPYEG